MPRDGNDAAADVCAVHAVDYDRRIPRIAGIVAEEDLVENVAPIQLAIRLLIPAGSRLLELEEFGEVWASLTKLRWCTRGGFGCARG